MTFENSLLERKWTTGDGKGIVKWVLETNADLVCLQETKAEPSQLTGSYTDSGYEVQFVSAQKGYSGVAIYSKTAWEYRSGLGFEEFDKKAVFGRRDCTQRHFV